MHDIVTGGAHHSHVTTADGRVVEAGTRIQPGHIRHVDDAPTTLWIDASQGASVLQVVELLVAVASVSTVRLSKLKSSAASAEPPVASMGSTTISSRFSLSAGSLQ